MRVSRHSCTGWTVRLTNGMVAGLLYTKLFTDLYLLPHKSMHGEWLTLVFMLVDMRYMNVFATKFVLLPTNQSESSKFFDRSSQAGP